MGQWIRSAVAVGMVAIVSGCLHVKVEDVHVDQNKHMAGPKATGLVAMSTGAEGESRPAMLYVPRDYSPSKEWPLIVFLHGAGERGDDGVRQTGVGIGPAILDDPDRFPCLVFMPQCPKGIWWGSIPGRSEDNSSEAHITDGIETILEHYSIDEDRVYLTGLSMGGYGTFLYGANHIDRFAALMPICGGGDPAWGPSLAKKPMRVFHGGDDGVVPPSRSEEMVEAIKAAGGDVELKIYPGVGHNSWDDAYSKKEGAVEWLLGQSR